jgi:micrococcal nuclease
MYQYKAKCLRVVDGDTVELEVDLGFSIRYIIRGRLYNVYAPELFSGKQRDKGALAKKFLEETIANKNLVVNTHKDQMTFNRWVIELHDDQGVNLNEVVNNYCKTLIQEAV